MTTDELIGLLARSAGAVEPNAVARRYGTALGWGSFGATLLMALVLGVRPDLREAALLPMFWIKLAFPASLLVVGVAIAARLARPGMRLGRLPIALVAPLVAVWAMAAIELAAAAPAARAQLVFGSSWRECPFNIAMLSVPAFVAVFWAMRRLAPTQLVRAGTVSGLIAGALGASIYALHCTEMAATFLGIWYVIGMLIPAALGALLGPRLLRW
jgi:hypothetical protein